jgi:autotransporter-associated beta strand protein
MSRFMEFIERFTRRVFRPKCLRSWILCVVTWAGITSNSGAATTRIWTGASATSGNWTTAANWQGGVAPSPGDILQFVDTGARKASNTNNFAAGTTFSVINCFGNGYRLRGNRVTITNSMNVGNPPGSHIIDLDMTLGPLDGSASVSAFDAAASLTINGDINLVSHTLLTDGAGDITIAGVISGTGGVFKNNPGELSFSGLGANTYSGSTIVARGILRLNRYNIGPGLTLVGTTAIAGDLSIGDFVSTLIGDIAVLDRENQIANTSTVFVNATGSLELSDENDTVGELRLRGGTVTTGAGNLGVEGGIYATLPLNVSKDSLIAGRLTLGSRGAGPQLVDVAQDVELRISAQISGVSTAHLIKTNRGDLLLSASNIFSGDVEIVGGRVIVSDGSALGNTTGVTKPVVGTIVIRDVGTGGEVLEVTGPAGVLTMDNLSSSWNGSVILHDDLLITVPTNRTLGINGQISGPAGWTKIGPGTLTLRTTFTHTYAGTSDLRQGDVVLENVFSQTVIPGRLVIGDGNGGANADRVRMLFGHGIGDTSAVTINNSGELVMSGHDDTIGSLAGPGNVSLGDGILTVGGNNSSTLFSGVISGTGNLVKTGTATLRLTGANTYSGVTSNLNGTLLVDGSLNSTAVQVRPGSVLGGIGQVQAISVFVNGTVRPGASPGNLSASTVLFPLGTLDIELNGLVAGTEYDRLTSSGTVTLGGVLQVSPGFVPALGSSFTILNKTSAGAITGTFNGLAEGTTFAAGGLLFQITYTGGNGNDVVLTRVAAPASDISSITPLTTERMHILGQGVSFVTYVLEASPHLNAPIPWVPIATNQANALGIYEFIDAYADGGMNLYPARFYRVQSP